MEEEEAPLSSMWKVRLCGLFGKGECLFIAFDIMYADCPADVSQTFFISDPASKEESRPARACDACYETVFPLIDGPSDGETDSSANGHNPDYRTINSDALGTLCGFPPWLSMPVLPDTSNAPAPKALMDIDLDGEWERNSKIVVEDPKRRARLRSRPRSYHQILDDFSHEEKDKDNKLGRGRGREGFDVVNVPLEEGEDEEDEDGADERGDGEEDANAVSKAGMDRPALSSSPRKENTARRVKRFSLPAVALQTTSVTARTGFVNADSTDVGESKMSKRFSLILGGGGHGKRHSVGRSLHGGDGEQEGSGNRRIEKETGSSVAVSKLSELLGRRK